MTTNDVTGKTESVAGDGMNGAVSKEELQEFISEARRIASGAARYVTERRAAAEEIRHCVWPGQSPDGRKHAAAQDDRRAFPFEGAADARVRLADQIVNERVLVLTAAALRNLPRVKGLELQQEGLGHKLTTLLKWVLRNKLGSEYIRTITKLAQYQEGDSPAGAILGVWWEQETALELRELSLEQLKGVLLQTFGLPPTEVARIEGLLYDPAQEAEAVSALQQVVPHLSAARARACVESLRETGNCTFPAPYLRVDQPELCAYRLFESIYFPTSTAKVSRARCFFIREWVSKAELQERVVSAGYDKDWVPEVLKHEGKSGWPLAEGDLAGEVRTVDPLEHAGEYELNTVFFRAVNDDLIPGIYYFPFSFWVESAGHERRLMEYDHGQYPFTYFSREILSERLIDARGVPELVATEQQALKLLTDSFSDNVSLSTLPNIKVPRRRSKLSLVIGPLKVIQEDRPGDVSWMQPPAYPAGNDKQQEAIRQRVDEYWGRMSERVPMVLQQLHQAGMVLQFLGSLSDGLSQMLQLCQQYMSDEELQLITGEDGIPIARSRAEIQGRFAVELSFDPRDLNMEYMKQLAELIVMILQIDTLNVVQRDKLVQRLFTGIDPSLAMETVRSVEDANQHEAGEEEQNFAKIAAGIEPAMVASGQNFPLRLQTLMGIVQKNPEALQKLSPQSRAIFQARAEYLQNQVQQLKNAQIGRQVGVPALGGEKGAPGTGGAGMGIMGGMGGR